MADLHSSSSALHMISALVERTCSFSDSLSLAYARLAPQALQQTYFLGTSSDPWPGTCTAPRLTQLRHQHAVLPEIFESA